MSDDLVMRLRVSAAWEDVHDAADLIEAQAAEIVAKDARIAELEAALKAAAEDIGDWGAYASQYLQEKWDLLGEVKRYTAISEGKLPYRARYSMEEPKDE